MIEIKDDEYLNADDGLLYCINCHTARQFRLETGGRVLTPRILCRCQKVEYDRLEAIHKKQEFMQRVSRLKSNGLQDKSLREYTFANDKGYNPEMKIAHEYVKQFPKMKDQAIGLLLWGDVGTGKSFFAGCIANALLDKGIPVMMTNFAKIINELTGMYASDRNNFIDSLNSYSLLIIDDLGIERNTDYALEQVFNVIDSRCRSRLPLIVTTNLTIHELKNPDDLAHSRIYDRVLEYCIPLKINNLDIRKLKAEEKMKEARKLIENST